MRFTALATVAVVATSVFASPAPAPAPAVAPATVQVELNPLSLFGVDLSSANHYGAPNPPWVPGANPGWYYGDHPELFPELVCLLDNLLCAILDLLPFDFLHCPKPPPHNPPPPPPAPSDGYTQTFSNLTGATQADSYMTFGLVDTVSDCQAMCNSTSGCDFVNTYHDVNGKGGSTQLTCSLFTTCQNASTAINTGGQTQPDGSVDFITNSDGWCKDS